MHLHSLGPEVEPIETPLSHIRLKGCSLIRPESVAVFDDVALE